VTCRYTSLTLGFNTGFAQSGEVLLELFKLLFCEGAIRLNHAVDRIASSPHLLHIVLGAALLYLKLEHYLSIG